ncbi:rod shape-determining protein MreD [Enterococcus sp. LJL98]
MISKRIQYGAPFLFFFLILIDAHLTQLLTAFNQNRYIWRSHLALIAFLFAVRYLPKNYLLVTSLIIGGIFDLYYLGLLGIYIVVFPLTIALMSFLKEIIFENSFNLFFGMIIFVTFFEIVILFIQVIFNLIHVDLLYFVTQLLAPTLLLNMGLFLITMYPLKKIFW